MSPNINSFVGDLVEMARAMEELPDVKAKLTSANSFIDDLAKTVQERELRIIELKAEIDRQAHAITTLEVARDDAELRFLELDEKSHKALEVIDWLSHNAAEARDLLSPPKPQPEPEVQAQPVDPKPEPSSIPEAPPAPFSQEASLGIETGSSGGEVAMSGDPSNVDSWASGPALPDWAQDKAETSLIKPTGQSEVGEQLIGQDAMAPATSSTLNAIMAGVDTSEPATTSVTEPKPSGRYSGKRYYDWATGVSLTEWLDGGGTQADYDWRPGKIASC